MTDQPVPLVSVIVPAHDAALHVEAAVRSALAQSVADLEVIVVDDASTDGTLAVARALAADPRVRVLASPTNLGVASARNLGLAAARGEWVALLDADDAFEPGRLAHLLAFARATGADLVADNLLLCPEDGGPRLPMLDPAELPSPRLLGLAAFVEGDLPRRTSSRAGYGFLKPLIRRSFLAAHGLRYESGMRFGEDYAFATACLAHGARLWLVPEPLYRYTLRGTSVTARHGLPELQRLLAVDRRLADHPRVRAAPAARRAVAAHARSLVRRIALVEFFASLKAGRPVRAGRFLLSGPGAAGDILAECWRAAGRRLRTRRPRDLAPTLEK